MSLVEKLDLHQLNYIEPVFRPPSEWRSLILQVTNGCSWNKCTFCEMYQEDHKRFNHKHIDEIKTDLQTAINSVMPVQRVFLADGDAMTLSVRRLAEILKTIKEYFPNIQRVSAYCLPRNLMHKNTEELAYLNSLGLKLLYVGCETGDDELLSLVEKGETFQSSLKALNKISASGIKSSVMILNGLGGKQLTRQHASNSARLMNESQPDYLSTLVVGFPRGMQRYQKGFPDYVPLSQQELFEETYRFINLLELEKTIFRSDHASNYLVLKGILNRDKDRLIQQVEMAIQHPEQARLRNDNQRGF